MEHRTKLMIQYRVFVALLFLFPPLIFIILIYISFQELKNDKK